ncbi:hypothetical protein CC2G_006181 [Coprinopsis cinerea AmutBmut pab1-1]|nr:hypothetical protein CC2G_006181 [Coprinopsis cinerea AmutBmut pab1-1]
MRSQSALQNLDSSTTLCKETLDDSEIMASEINKDRFYLAYYSRDGWTGLDGEQNRFDVGFLALPKNADPKSPEETAMAFLASGVPISGELGYVYSAKRWPVAAKIQRLHGLLYLGKLTHSRDQIWEILQKVPVAQGKDFDCTLWTRDAIKALQHEKVITDPYALAASPVDLWTMGHQYTRSHLRKNFTSIFSP